MKSSYFKKLSALVLSLAICMSFMPFVSVTAFAADGRDWHLIKEGTSSDYDIELGEDQESVDIDIRDYLVLKGSLTYDDFEYSWYDDDAEESREDNPVFSAGAGYYSCRFTNKNDEEDWGTAYFHVYAADETPVAHVKEIKYASSGIREVKEFTNGWFRQDGREDENENFIPESDYYFYYNNEGNDSSDGVWFNLGDKITLIYDDNTTDVYEYNTYTDTINEDGETWTRTRDEFRNSEGETIWPNINFERDQTYATRLEVGSKIDATIGFYDYDSYEYISTVAKDFAQIVKNPGAVWVNGAFYRLNEYDKSADLRGFYSKNPVTEFKVPAKVTMGDGKDYPVRHMSSDIWEYNNSSLKQLTVPSSVHNIEDFAFGLTDKYDDTTGKWVAEPIKDFTLYAATGSAAYEYAKEYGIKVVDNNPATNGTALAEAQANAEAKAKEAEEAKANAAAKAAEAEAAKNDSGAKAKEVEAAKAEAAAAKAEAEAKAKEAEAAKNEVLALKAQLKKIKGFKATAKKKGKAQINWKKTAGVTGYQVYRSTKKTSGFKKVATIKKVSTLKWNDKKLKSGKKYYYKVRTYTTVNGKNYYGQWSEVKMIKGKK